MMSSSGENEPEVMSSVRHELKTFVIHKIISRLIPVLLSEPTAWESLVRMLDILTRFPLTSLLLHFHIRTGFLRICASIVLEHSFQNL